MTQNIDLQRKAREFATILRSELELIPQWNDIRAIVELNVNSLDDVWLIGGIVSRTLARKLYGGPAVSSDIDILTTGLLKKEIKTLPGWTLSTEKFGNPTFTKGNTSIDLWSLHSHEYLKAQGKESTIENFLAVVPYTIQSLVYNIKTGELRGEKGIIALLRKEFQINNTQYAQIEASRKNQTVKDRMEKKAKSMGFVAVH